jgi:uncharacterized membrane protein
MLRAARLCLASLLLGSLVAAAQGPAFCTFNNFSIDPNDGTGIPEGIDHDGTIVGLFIQNSGAFVGFTLAPDGTFSTYSAPNSSNTAILRRSAGVNVGFYLPTASSAATGFIATDTTFQNVMFPGADQTHLMGINQSGVVVGSYDLNQFSHAIKYENGTFTSVEPPGATWSEARAINDSGTIVGTYSTDPQALKLHGFVLKNGAFTTVDFPHADNTQLSDISDTGEIVGLETILSKDTDNGFILKNHRFEVVTDNGARALLTGINDQNVITGRVIGGTAFTTSCR